MKIRRWFFLFVMLGLAACSQASSSTPGTGTRPAGAGGNPLAQATNVPDVKAAARAYLEAWKAEDYAAMYNLLTSVSKSAISQEEFSKHYRGVAEEAALSGIDYAIQSALVNPDNAQVNFQTILHSALVGDIQRGTVMNLRLEGGQWRVEWNDTLVLPELAGGNYLGMVVDIPARANIYDHNGHALVAQADATAVGLQPDLMRPDQESALFDWLQRLTGLDAQTIQTMYAGFPSGANWYLPLAEVPADLVAKNYDELSKFSGLVLNSYKSRYYFDGGIAPHVIGYVGKIRQDQLETYTRLGYKQDELVGQAGLEQWGEKYLAGKRGAALYVYNSQGQFQTRLKAVPAQPSQAVYTTLDRGLQVAAQEAIASFRGAIVVLERDTGRVLAMVSSPGFDPNAFVPGNFNSNTLLAALNSEDHPLLNRAAQGQYPLGSVFKTVTMAAALESGVYTPDTTYFCGTTFDELKGVILHDWTYEMGVPASGMLTLQGGLIRSCNPYFFHIGLDLYDRGLESAVSDMARSFGLGSATGIEGIDEAPGQVLNPENEVDATNGAIGQGSLLVTPLQVADFIAAIGNGGTLYRPQIVEKVVPPGGDPTYQFQALARGKLPLKPENLKAIQDALVGVVRSSNPRGTAWYRFTGLDVKVAGKTGTAQSGSGLPHAWFVGYTFEERQDLPDIAVAVVVENVGEGSDYAAPIFRRVIEYYFFGQFFKVYPWETQLGEPGTPAPQTTGTPSP